MTDAVKDLWHTLATVAPKAALFAAILAVGWLAARAAGTVVGNLLWRAGLQRLVDRTGLNRVLGNNYAHELAGKLVYLAVLLVVLQLAFGVFGPNPVSALITSVIAFLPRLFVAIALVLVAATIANTVRTLIGNALGALSYAKAVATAASGAILGLGVIAALGQVGVALAVTMPVLIAVLAAVVGVVVVGVGGGLIQPMQLRWENYLAKAEAEAQSLRAPAELPEPEPVTTTVTVRRRKTSSAD